MSLLQVALLLVGLLLALGVSAFTYLRREPQGRGRTVLVVLRTLVLALIVLLLFDPRLNFGARGTRGGPRVILDASLSMLLGEQGNSAWQQGVAQAQRANRNNAVLLAGDGVRTASADSLDRITPYAGDSRLLPALASAAEGGAQRVVVVTDGAVEDAAEIERWLPTLGVTLDVRTVGGARPANRAVSNVEAPAWAEAGKPLTLRVSVASTSSGRAAVVVRQNGNQIARSDVQPVANGVAATALSFTAQGPPSGGLVRYDVALEQADAIPDDDVRSVYVFISEKPAGVAIVSFDPDWEPRFLHPVIESALGLPVRTFLRAPTGMYFRVAGGLEAGSRVDESSVQSAVAQADLLVLHGFGANAPEWALRAAANARQLMVFPAQSGTQIPIATSAAAEGDWYISSELPASPISPLLAGIDVSALPPLSATASTVVPDNAWVPLLAGRSRRGGNAPVVVAEERAGRRWVIALGVGYWRWAFRGGAARDVYTRLWGALAGWVVQDQAQVAGAAVRPVERAVARATPLRWIAPGLAADSLALVLNGRAGQTRATLTPQLGDTAISAAPAPGHYNYDIAAYSGGREVARARGPITVETYSPEFMRRAVDLQQLTRASTSLTQARRGAGRPLHTYPSLYVLLAALLCTEWVLRRRWGLR